MIVLMISLMMEQKKLDLEEIKNIVLKVFLPLFSILKTSNIIQTADGEVNVRAERVARACPFTCPPVHAFRR